MIYPHIYFSTEKYRNLDPKLPSKLLRIIFTTANHSPYTRCRSTQYCHKQRFYYNDDLNFSIKSASIKRTTCGAGRLAAYIRCCIRTAKLKAKNTTNNAQRNGIPTRVYILHSSTSTTQNVMRYVYVGCYML